MSAKRALVVDDSKSARAFLTRILERYALTVDTAQSAEEALTYLAGQQPDVIFMDHLMPGMDGFQALQAIKNNPRTATIPIMMYTSQEGELYLSQARALGALGVLPKQIRPADVSRALLQLKLISEAESSADASLALAPASVPPAGEELLGALPEGLRPALDLMLREHYAVLRRAVQEQLDAQADRLGGEVRQALHDQAHAIAPPRTPQRPRLAWTLCALAAAAALALAVLWSQARLQTRQAQALGAAATTQLMQARAELAAAQSAQSAQAAQAVQLAPVEPVAQAELAAPASTPAPVAAPPPEATAVGAEPLVLAVPFGEAALAGARVDRIQALLARLQASSFHGTVTIRTYSGRFCLSGVDGAALSAPDQPYSHCDRLGNPQGDAPGSAAGQSVAFANMLAAAHKGAAGAFEVQVVAGNAEELPHSYPEPAEALSAGEWNRAAAANNRVEVHWRASRP